MKKKLKRIEPFGQHVPADWLMINSPITMLFMREESLLGIAPNSFGSLESRDLLTEFCSMTRLIYLVSTANPQNLATTIVVTPLPNEEVRELHGKFSMKCLDGSWTDYSNNPMLEILQYRPESFKYLCFLHRSRVHMDAFFERECEFPGVQVEFSEKTVFKFNVN